MHTTWQRRVNTSPSPAPLWRLMTLRRKLNQLWTCWSPLSRSMCVTCDLISWTNYIWFSGQTSSALCLYFSCLILHRFVSISDLSAPTDLGTDSQVSLWGLIWPFDWLLYANVLSNSWMEMQTLLKQGCSTKIDKPPVSFNFLLTKFQMSN